MDKSSATDMQSKASITSSHDGDVDESILPYVPSHADASADNNWDHGVHVDLLSQGAPRRAQGVWLEWDQLKVEVLHSNGLFKPKTPKTIVHSSRGRVGPGEILAVMGPSGAGKTSLFNSLARRGTGYTVSGKQTLNGMPYSKDTLGSVAGFVFQEPVMHSHVKVEETLLLAADLKLPKSVTREEKRRRVDVLLDAFDLRKCANTKVGDSKVKGISGGEKKRLSIAIEVLRGEPLLFLDEPTSGLDASSSLMVVRLLRALADSGTSVVMVLHTPRASILRYIDNFLILSNGRDVYYGDLHNMMLFFQRVGFPIPLRVNPLDYVLDIVNTNEQLSELMGTKPIALSSSAAAADPLAAADESRSFAHILRGSTDLSLVKHREKMSLSGTDFEAPAHSVDRKELAEWLAKEYVAFGLFEKLAARDAVVMPSLQNQRSERSAFLVRIKALLRREFTQKVVWCVGHVEVAHDAQARNPEVYATQIGGACVLSLIMGSIYYQLGPTQIFDKMAGLSFAGVMVIFLCFHLILSFSTDRLVWLRDRDNGLYGAMEYYWSIVLAGLPGDLMGATILATILYWMMGLTPQAANYFTFLGFYLLSVCVASSMLYLGGAIAPSPSVANSLVSVILLFAMLFNGFFLIYIPVWWYWISVVNFLRFQVTAIYLNEFRGQVYNCTPGVTPGCGFATGDAVLLSRGISPSTEMWTLAVYMIIVMVVMHTLANIAVAFCYTGYASELSESFSRKRNARKELDDANADESAAQNGQVQP